MKKFLCIFLCCFLCLSLLTVSAFATDTVVDTSSSSGPPSSLNGTSWRFPNDPASTASLPSGRLLIDFVSNGQRFTRLTVNSSGIYFLPEGDSSNLAIYHTSTGWESLDYMYITFTSDIDSSSSSVYPGYIDWFYTYCDWLNKPSPMEVSGGVNAFLQFCGSVFRFCSSNSLALVAISLSIGLFFVVPFTIRKFKQFVKGY